MPGRDAISRFLHRTLGARAAHFLTRWKNILYTMVTFNLSRWKPHIVRHNIMKHIRAEVGDRLDVDKHFRPPYDPWDQRLCLRASDPVPWRVRASEPRPGADRAQNTRRRFRQRRRGFG
ncbi:MAG: FAD-containing monooxygenase EthA, partial [Pseudomonadota bacterium]